MKLMFVPIVTTMVVGATVLLDFFIRNDALISVAREFMNWGVIIAAFATGLGAANLLRIHGTRTQQRRLGWGYSVLLLASLIAYTVLGVLSHSSSQQYQFIFGNVLQPLSATVFSFNAFFMTSAAYRAFRVRSVHATVLLVTAVIVMLGRVGIGEVIYSGMPAISGWIGRVPTTGAFRGITIGAALGAIALSLRILAGIERTQFGGVGGGSS